MSGTRAERVRRISVGVATCCLCLVAASTLLNGMHAVREFGEVDYGEPIVYGLAARIVEGQPLYQALDRPPYTVAAYTPLYYYAAAALQAWLGAGFAFGRALSYTAGLVSGVLVGLLATRLARTARAGVFAGLTFLGLGFAGPVPWMAMYRVDCLGVALSLGAITCLMYASGPWLVILAGSVAGLAFLTKQTLVAAGIAGAIWLWRGNRRYALLFTAPALGVGIIPCLVLQLQTGALVANTLLANVAPVAVDQVVYLAPAFVTTVGPIVCLAAVNFFLRPASGGSPTTLMAVYWLLSALPLIGLLKYGALYNYWIEFAASGAVLSALAIWNAHWSECRIGWVLSCLGVWLLIATVVGANAPAFADWVVHPVSPLAQDTTHQSELRDLVARVRTETGDVLADPLDVVVLANKPVLLEPVVFGILGRQQQWDSSSIVRRICGGDIHLLILGAPIGVLGSMVSFGVPRWPEDVMAALRERMQLQQETAGRFVYATAPPGSAADLAVCRA